MAKEGLLGALEHLAASLSDAAPEGPRNVWTTIGPWVAELTRSASQLWLPHLLTGIPCEVRQRHPSLAILLECKSPAIAACSVCRKPVCLDHAFVARSGQAVCYPCIKQDIDDHAHAGAPPPRRHPPHPGAPPPHENSEARYAPPNGAPPPRPPPDPTLPARLIAARKVLKVKRATPWAEVEASYKDLLRKYHPDRNPLGQERATVLFKEVRVAYDLLKLHHPGAPS